MSHHPSANPSADVSANAVDPVTSNGNQAPGRSACASRAFSSKPAITSGNVTSSGGPPSHNGRASPTTTGNAHKVFHHTVSTAPIRAQP